MISAASWNPCVDGPCKLLYAPIETTIGLSYLHTTLSLQAPHSYPLFHQPQRKYHPPHLFLARTGTFFLSSGILLTMLGRVQRLLNYVHLTMSIQVIYSSHSNGQANNRALDDEASLFLQNSAGNTIIMQSSYPTASVGFGDLYKCTRKSDSVSDEVSHRLAFSSCTYSTFRSQSNPLGSQI